MGEDRRISRMSAVITRPLEKHRGHRSPVESWRNESAATFVSLKSLLTPAFPVIDRCVRRHGFTVLDAGAKAPGNPVMQFSARRSSHDETNAIVRVYGRTPLCSQDARSNDSSETRPSDQRRIVRDIYNSIIYRTHSKVHITETHRQSKNNGPHLRY